MRIIKCIAISLFVILGAQSKNYYFSSKGNDLKQGNRPSVAWQSIQKLVHLELKAGDSVLFRRGDIFSGEIVVRQSGKAGMPIVFSAYGTGELPMLSGAVQLTGAVKNTANQQVFNVNQKVIKLYLNDKKQTLARYPNNAYLTMGKGIDSIGFETSLTEPNGFWVGASIGMRTIDWVFEHRKIASFKNMILKFDANSIYKIEKGYGYFLEDKPELIDANGEWFSSDKSVQILSNENLNEQKVEGVIFQNCFTLLPGVKNIVISSLKIDKYAASGIWAQQGSGNLNIINNKIQNTGLMGVWLDTLVSNVNVKNNLIEDIAGRGISGIRNINCTIEHNRIRRVGMWPGEGVSGVNGMEAIVIENQEKNHALSNASNNRIAFNEVDSTGYVGIRLDGKNSICEFNVVKNTSLKLNDSGAIYCFGKVKNRTHNNRISNNLIINAVGNIEATPSNGMATNGIYIDNNSTQILVENNTVIHTSSNGIFINDGSPKNIIRSNTTFNCEAGIAFAEWANKDSLYGNFIEKNTVVCAEKSQLGISLTTFLGSSLFAGKFSNNTYINAHDGFFLNYKTDPEKGQRRSDLFRLANWQKVSGDEIGSRSIERKGAKIIYNDSFTMKEIPLPEGNFTDIEGNKLGKNVQLNPCASLIIVPVE